MSAAKMVADSTQSDLTSETSVRTRRKKNADKKTRKSKKSGRKALKKKEEDALLNDPDLDLSREVKDIGEYIRDRQELLKQMFNAVQGSSLQRALPEVLRGMSLDVLKKKCLEHLEVMSRKRIRRILDGDDPATISSSSEDDTTDEEALEGDAEITSHQAADSTSQAGEQDSQDLSAEVEDQDVVMETGLEGEESDAGEWRTPPPDEGSDVEEEGKAQEEMEKEGKKELSEDGSKFEAKEVNVEKEEIGDVEADKMEEEANHGKGDGDLSCENKTSDSGKVEDNMDKTVEEVVTKSVKEMETETSSGSIFPMLTRNQMELLELEMRARAIKAMLKKHQGKNN